MAVKCNIINIANQEINYLNWGIKPNYGIKLIENYIENLACETSNYLTCYNYDCNLPAIITYYELSYWGWKNDDSILTVNDIEASIYNAGFAPTSNIITDYKVNNQPKYLWVAIPKDYPIATSWYGSLNNEESIISGDQNFFRLPVLVSNKYNFYITNYPSQQEDTTIEFKH